jgi:hypothetical protein
VLTFDLPGLNAHKGSPAGLPQLEFGAEKLPAREANSEHGVRVHFVRPEAE